MLTPFALLLDFFQETQPYLSLWVSFPRYAPYLSHHISRSDKEEVLTLIVHSGLA